MWWAIPAVSSYICVHITGRFLWLTLKFTLFYIPVKLILLCTRWLYIQLFTSNQITEIYKCLILEVCSIPMLYEWVGSSLFDLLSSKSTGPARYMSFLLIDPFGSQKDGNNVCVNQWRMNCTWISCVTFHPVWQQGVHGPLFTSSVVASHLFNVTLCFKSEDVLGLCQVVAVWSEATRLDCNSETCKWEKKKKKCRN